MKFAREFKQVLQKEGFPDHWIEAAVPYGSLKKCIKKVERELKSLGLDAVLLARLLNSSPDPQILPRSSDNPSAPVAFRYNFAEDPGAFKPKLTIYIQGDSGLTLDATLSPDTRKFFQKLSADHHKTPLPDLSLPDSHFDDELACTDSRETLPTGNIKRVEVPLTFDSEFFGLLQNDVFVLDALQAEEQKQLTDEIAVLGKEVSRLANTRQKSSKTDLDRWRELFDIYLQAGVFFSTNEINGGSRTATIAAKQLTWFQSEVTKRQLVKQFRLPASKNALERFTMINVKLLRNLRFQEINQLAISKILKKFDKRTSLGAKTAFPKLIQGDPFMSGTMAKAVCASVSNEIIKIIPQMEDYLCPICMGISYKPVRLSCGHVFCIRCMIQMQRENAKKCPICRDDAVLNADSANVDLLLQHFLEQWFPKETRLKQKENEVAAGIDMYGDAYVDTKCNVM